MSDALYYTTYDSAIGKLLLVASGRGLRFITLLNEGEKLDTFLAQFPSVPVLLPAFFESAIAAIDAYLERGTELKLPFDLVGGTALQRIVWLAISRIPYGKTLSYTELSERVNFPRAVRAVASACGANPIPLLIPCHRVVAKDGGLGGFSLGGVHIKERLLALESVATKAAAA